MYFAIIQNITSIKIKPEVMDEHRAFVDQIRKEEKLYMAGPFTDFSGGMIIVENENEDDVKSLMENDPAVKEGMLTNTIKPYKMTYIKK